MRNYRWILASLLGLLGGFGGETLLFLQRQSARIEQVLEDDFRLVLLLKNEPQTGKQKVLEDQLRALSDVADARYVSRQEAMAELRREDPELVESVGLLSDNPLDASFELRLKEEGFGRIESVVERAQAIAEFSDVRYKPAQVQAILQARFYERLLGVSLSACVCLAAVMCVAALWVGAQPGRFGLRAGAWRTWAEGAWAALASAGAAAIAAGLMALMATPLRAFEPWWAWPSPGQQAALITAMAAAGWVLCGLSS